MFIMAVDICDDFKLKKTVVLYRLHKNYFSALRVKGQPLVSADIPTNTIHPPYVVLKLAQRRRRGANFKTTLGGCLVFAGIALCDTICKGCE